MEGYYTGCSFVVIEHEKPCDNIGVKKTVIIAREFVSYEEACEFYGESISIIQSQQN